MKRALFVGALLAAATLAPLAAQADADDFEHQLTGRVISFEPYNLQLDRGPHIILHRGTVIRPTGLDLHGGMIVRVYGHRTERGNFSADEIDLIPRPPLDWRR